MDAAQAQLHLDDDVVSAAVGAGLPRRVGMLDVGGEGQPLQERLLVRAGAQGDLLGPERFASSAMTRRRWRSVSVPSSLFSPI